MSLITLVEYGSGEARNIESTQIAPGSVTELPQSDTSLGIPGVQIGALGRFRGELDFVLLLIAAANADLVTVTGSYSPPIGFAGNLASAALSGGASLLFTKIGKRVEVRGAIDVTWTGPGGGTITILTPPLSTIGLGGVQGLSTTTPNPLSAPDPEPSGAGPYQFSPNQAAVDLASSIGGPQRVAFSFGYDEP